jgi:aspartate--ammonia ligase
MIHSSVYKAGLFLCKKINHYINHKNQSPMKTMEVKPATAYQSALSEVETEMAVCAIKSHFAEKLSAALKLIKVEAPLLVEQGNGMNDDLNGIENPVSVKVKEMPEVSIEIVHSLAKWKRAKLARLNFLAGEGLYTDMKALRPDEDFSDVHSIFVDQWDWEKIIPEEERTIACLKKTVAEIYQAILDTETYMVSVYPKLKACLPDNIVFIHSEDLQQQYPHLDPKEREQEICRLHGAVFIIGIGAELADGKKHDGRAPDYDDWISETVDGKKGLNGDILVWNNALSRAFELSSMGIRVSPGSLEKQLSLSGNEDRLKLDWHQKLVKGELPFTIGGGIGQSRLAMLLLQKKHIGEVQSSIWPKEMVAKLKEQNIHVL